LELKTNDNQKLELKWQKNAITKTKQKIEHIFYDESKTTLQLELLEF